VEETDSRANNLHSRSPNCSNLPSNSTMEEDDGFETVWRKEDYLLPPGSIDFADNILVGVCLLPSVPRLLTPNCGPPCFIFVKFMFPQNVSPKLELEIEYTRYYQKLNPFALFVWSSHDSGSNPKRRESNKQSFLCWSSVASR
jgi:hypothetical protein